MRGYRSPDGTAWGVVVTLPSHSSAMVMFRHPDGQTSKGDRYAWINSHRAEANDPRERLSAKPMLDELSDAEVARLFRRSMPVSAAR